MLEDFSSYLVTVTVTIYVHYTLDTTQVIK